MANSFVRYTGNGSTTAYAIPFSYRSVDDLSTTVAGSAVTAYTLDGAGTTLTFDTAPASSAAIEIRRTTSQTTKLVDYVSGSVLTESDLDTDSDQAFYMSQEAIDKAGDVITLDNADFQWDVQSKRLKNVAAPTADTDAVNKSFISTNLPNITTVAGISSDVTTVAGISSDVTSVAADATDIGTVATNIANVNTVATNIADVVTVANDLNEAISEIETAANDLNEATSEIDTVATNIANVNTVGTNIANVNTVATDIVNVNSVAGNSTNINAVANDATDIGTVSTNIANVNTVAGINADVTTVASDGTDIGTVATNIANVNTVAGNNANITTVAGNDANITTVAGISSNVTTVANDTADIGTVATDISNVNTVAGSIVNVNTTATNIAGVNSFAERYRVDSTDPSTSLDSGDLVFNTGDSQLKYYDGSSWSVVANQDISTKVSANDATSGFLNGKLVAGSGISFTENNDGSNETLTIASALIYPTISSIAPDTVTNDASNIVITGTNFVITPTVEFHSTTGAVYYPNTVTRNSATQLTVNATLAVDGTYFIRVENPDGIAVRSSTALLTVSDAPTWTTASGSLGSVAQGGAFSATVVATSDSAITYSVQSGALPTGITLNTSTGVISGTESGSDTGETVYNFTLRATDAELQTADRAFSITITVGINNGIQFN